jgi:hypothetical protein
MAQYRSIIWDAWGGWNRQLHSRPLLYDLIRFIPESASITVQGRVQPNLIALFLASGGRILLCGEQPLTMSVNRQFLTAAAYPLILQYELLGDQDGYYEDQAQTTPPNPVGDRSFGFLDMCVDILDIAYTSYQAIRSSALHRCGIRTIRSVDPQEVGLRECIPADANFPPLTLRDEAGGPGKAYYTRGLNTDVYNPPYFTCFEHPMGPRDCFEPIYLNGCNDVNSNIYEAPVALWTSTHADSVTPRSVLWGFEPVFFDTTAVREALEYILFEEWGLARK